LTNDVHYLRRRDADAQAILMCIQTNSVIADGRPMGFETDEFYYKSTAEMAALFPNHPEALTNTARIAEKCQFHYTFGETFSCLQTADSLLPLLSGCLSILAGCVLLCRLFPGVRRRSDLLCGGLLVLSCLVYLADTALFLTLLHLATAIVFPCAAAYAIGEYAKKPDDRPMWQIVLRFTAGLTGWSLLGGLCVAAQMSTPVYLLGTDIFSGVKLALLLPMAFVVMVLLWNLRRQLVSSG
jgi:hypothetical protein